jgi:L-threonylcarbamoyladenylate synthase
VFGALNLVTKDESRTMITAVITADDPQSVTEALEVLRKGGLVAFPTDTVYGLGARVDDEEAIGRLYQVKKRLADNPIPVLVSTITDIKQVALSMPSSARKLAAAFWPGPLTLVVWRRSDVSILLSTESTVGVRMPDQKVALSLLDAIGPLAVTSANLSGMPNACTAEAVLDNLGGSIELILDGGETPGGIPSTVVDCTQDEPQILRAGPIHEEVIRAALS